MRLSLRPYARGASRLCVGLLGATLLGGSVTEAIQVDFTNVDSIKAASYTLATGMMKYYKGNETGQIPGLLPQPYYWWEAGAAFGALIDYWYYTGDTTYNDVTTEAMLFQVGPNNNFMPPNQSKTLGNDDQAFWGLAAMSAAENKFPNPPDNQPQWLALAQAVFNSQALRWDEPTCGGGLKWQIFTFNNGYNYKNSISNGCFFQLAARLAMYTGNKTYAEWAARSYEWSERVGLISPDYYIYDGSDDLINCTQLNHIQWSYNAGVYLLGAATMFRFTEEDPVWKTRTQGLLDGANVFFYNDTGIMYEAACEGNGMCDVDQRSFKAYLSRWMAASTKLAPFIEQQVMGLLTTSARAAAAQCSGGSDGVTCGIKWTNNGVWDGSFGVGEQMSALEVVQSMLISKVAGPVTNSTGGTSKGDNTAGTGGDKIPEGFATGEITTGDKVGAGFLTSIILIGVLGGAWWMIA